MNKSENSETKIVFRPLLYSLIYFCFAFLLKIKKSIIWYYLFYKKKRTNLTSLYHFFHYFSLYDMTKTLCNKHFLKHGIWERLNFKKFVNG